MQKFLDILLSDPGRFHKEYKKQFWREVGQIKRSDKPNITDIETASRIRNILYESRLGKTKPIFPNIIIFNLIGFSIYFLVFFSFTDLQKMYLSILIIAIFMIYYEYIVNFNFHLSLIVFTSVTGLSAVINIVLYYYQPSLFHTLIPFFLLATIPCFYLNGRYFGGLVAGIKFDGISRDIYGIYTLKINYPSYLSASPDKRQYIFLFGGLGTVIFGLIASAAVYAIFMTPYLFVFPFFLFIGELLDFYNLAGPLSGGEFHHLRRERKIIADWRKN